MSNYIPPTSRRRLPSRPPYVVTALRRKYAELVGLGDAKAEAIGAALLIFSPGEDLGAIKPVRPYMAERERWMATALAVLRKEARPMKAREIALRVMEAHQLDPQDTQPARSIEFGLHAVLGRMEGAGVVRVG